MNQEDQSERDTYASLSKKQILSHPVCSSHAAVWLHHLSPPTLHSTCIQQTTALLLLVDCQIKQTIAHSLRFAAPGYYTNFFSHKDSINKIIDIFYVKKMLFFKVLMY
jgi:hypothetical protein